MEIKAVKTVIPLGPKELMDLASIIADEDAQGALRFLTDVIAERVRCYQTESHRPQFEGGTGREASHFLQRGVGHVEAKKEE